VEKIKYSVTKSVLIENSSNVAAVAYTDIGALLVTFKGGSQYIYKHVPEEVYEEMTKTESAGKYLNVNIKGKYEFEKIEDKKKEEINSAEVTHTEIVASAETDEEQAVLQILKSKGAPIAGTFLLEFDKAYNWTGEENPLNNVTTFTWTKK
jgi:hypothetical protein